MLETLEEPEGMAGGIMTDDIVNAASSGALCFKYLTHTFISIEERDRLREEWAAMWNGRADPIPLLFICQRGADIQPVNPSDAKTIAEWVRERFEEMKGEQ